mmetsp:Transcript_5673/g.17294  ORF Transcript_5673/g.17294 Transcript_5673/m.17294 type:complete len:479 (-) Transcript_5673:522-1958(-)
MTLSVENINPNLLKAEYAVRGEIVAMATRIKNELEEGKGDHPFKKVLFCNIGNPQVLGQKPLTYYRQVLALCEYPQMLDTPEAAAIFPQDVKDLAKHILAGIPGGVGAYSESAGAPILRKMVADAITRRDEVPCDWQNVFLTGGASPAVHHIMTVLVRSGMRDGLLVPLPQYPLYSASLTLYGGELVPYMLDESTGWGMTVPHLKQQLEDARSKGITVRGLVVINPGNPTGQCLSHDNQREVVQFCKDEGLVCIADEVYQSNVYAEGKSFASFKKVTAGMGLLDAVPLVSLHSISKGFTGECGRRGGYMELTGFSPEVKAQITKLVSIHLCSTLSGQICVALMMNPPKPGEPSYDTYLKERDGILSSLKRRAMRMVDALNKMEGVTCNAAEGAMYAFPQITLPPKAIEAADKIGKKPDWLYCHDLLVETGIVVVPGSGFGQEDGTNHFRTTFLPSEDDIEAAILSLSKFHVKFMAKYK